METRAQQCACVYLVKGSIMRHFLLRLIINAVALAIIVKVLPQGIRIEGDTPQTQIGTLLGIALLFGLVNALVKPIVKLLTCPFIFFTFGLFLLVINGLMFMLVAELSKYLPGESRLVVDSFLWAMVGAFIMSVVGLVLERVLGVNDNVKVKTVREVRYVRDPRGYDDAPSFPPPMPDDEKPKR
jgi:putative membrane protein